MYTMIFATLVGAVIGVRIGFKTRDETSLPLFDCILLPTLMYSAMACFAGYLAATFIDANVLPVRQVETAPVELYCAQSPAGNACVLVYTGRIGGNDYYIVYARNADGIFTERMLPFFNARVSVVKDASLSDRGYWTQTWQIKDRESFWNIFTVGFDGYGREGLVSQILRVPVDSVVHTTEDRRWTPNYQGF